MTAKPPVVLLQQRAQNRAPQRLPGSLLKLLLLLGRGFPVALPPGQRDGFKARLQGTVAQKGVDLFKPKSQHQVIDIADDGG